MINIELNPGKEPPRLWLPPKSALARAHFQFLFFFTYPVVPSHPHRFERDIDIDTGGSVLYNLDIRGAIRGNHKRVNFAKLVFSPFFRRVL